MTHHMGLAFRRLRKTPGITAIVLASLALSIGLNILIFSFTSPVLIKGLPYPEIDRLLDVSMAPPDRPEARGPVTPTLYPLLRDRTSAAFAAIGVFDAGRTANIAGDSSAPAIRVDGHRISATGLAALGTPPLLGRLPVAADEQADATPTIVLSYSLWQKRFGGRTDVVNQTVNIDGQPTLIIGVMPEGFGLLDNSSDAWFAHGFEPAQGQEFQHALRAVGRLKPGVSLSAAQAAVKVALDEYAQQNPNADQGWTVELTPWRDARFGGLRRPFAMVQAAFGALLLLLCVSLVVLLRSRRTAAMASSPGDGGGVLAESLLLGLTAGALGALLTIVGLPALLEITPRALPRLSDVGVHAGVLGFGVALSVLAGLVLALRSSRPRPATTPGASGLSWAGRISASVLVLLLALQTAIAFVLLAGTGLGTRAFSDLRGRNLGIDVSRLLAFDVHLPRSPYVVPGVARIGNTEISEYSPAGPAVFDKIRAALQTTPGVVAAAGVASQPFSNAPFVQFWIGDQEQTPDNRVAAQYLAVTENYFNTMGIRVTRGRDFSAADQPDTPWVVLVNETLARQHWPDADPIGQQLTLTFQPNDGEPMRAIVGVVADTIPFRGASEVPPLIYVLHRQQALQQRASFEGRRTVMSFITRTEGDPLALGERIPSVVGQVDLTTPVAAVRTVESYSNAGQVALLDFAATLLGVVAFVAVVAATVGVYSLTVYGIAQGRQTMTLLVRAAIAVGVGIVVGRVVWLRIGSVIESLLTNITITPSDPTTLGLAAGVLGVAALMAVLVPALRRGSTGR